MLQSPLAGSWCLEDSLLAQAFDLWEATRLCSGCGFPKRLAHDDENDGCFEVETTLCVACEARDQWASSENKNPSGVPGDVAQLVFCP